MKHSIINSKQLPYSEMECYAKFNIISLVVQDTNDHPPVFTQNGYYEQTIPENTPPGNITVIHVHYQPVII